jgi:hypothetical protein
LAPAILVLALALVSQTQTQRKPAPAIKKPAPLVFGQDTSRLHLASAPAASFGAVKFPVSIKSRDYSFDYARRNLIPAMGGSIATTDFDGDGWPDLYVVVPGGANRLLASGPDGTFSDVTEKAKVQGTGSDLGAAFGDFDKSGHPSLFVAGLGGVILYRNNGDGTFTDITAKAGLKGKAGELATSVLLFDADGDGFLDALVTIYTDLSTPPSKAVFTFPNDFSGVNSRLYHNQQDGTFSEITEKAGLTPNPGRTRKALAADFSGSGRMDLLILRDDKPPALFRNEGQGKFEDKTWDAGSEIWKYAYVDAQTGDFDGNGKTDAVLWSTIGNEVILNQGDGKFKQDETFPLVYAANRAFGFHGLAGDLEGIGSVDLLTVDDKGGWHFLANRGGRFAEAEFSLIAEDGKAGSYACLTALNLAKATDKNAVSMSLVGLTMDGQVKIFQREPNRDVHGPSDAKKRQ